MVWAACRITSRPVRSSVASGPIACPNPSLHARSMSAGVAMPASTRATASLSSATSRRDVTNPATSRSTTMQVLPSASANARARIVTAIQLDDLADADIVVEAVFEELEVKQHVFRAIDALARPGAVLA